MKSFRDKYLVIFFLQESFLESEVLKQNFFEVVRRLREEQNSEVICVPS